MRREIVAAPLLSNALILGTYLLCHRQRRQRPRGVLSKDKLSRGSIKKKTKLTV